MITLKRPAGTVTETASTATTRVAPAPYTFVSPIADAAAPSTLTSPNVILSSVSLRLRSEDRPGSGSPHPLVVYDRVRRTSTVHVEGGVIRVLLVDDEQLVRAGLRMILEHADDIEVVAEAADGAEAVEQARWHRPDAVLMDIRMPHVDGLTATRQITALPDPPKVIVLTTFELDEYVHTALEHGAVGFLLKDTPPPDLLTAVRTVVAGNAMLSPTVTKRLIAAFTSGGGVRAAEARTRLQALTDREREVVVAVAQGLSNAEIGERLFMSEATVKAHLSRVLAKLRLSNRVQAAILVQKAGLLD
jgi:DNA-binding NarL/FixJ family response regulator